MNSEADQVLEEKTFVRTIKSYAPLISMICGFISIIMQGYGFFNLYVHDYAALHYFVIGVGYLGFIVTMVYFGCSRKRIEIVDAKNEVLNIYHPKFWFYKYARIFIVVAILVPLILGWQAVSERRVYEDNTVALIAKFSGPKTSDELIENTLYERLQSTFQNYPDLIIEPIDTEISLTTSKNNVEKIIRNNIGDLLIWGWYSGETSGPEIYLHIEISNKNLSNVFPEEFTIQVRTEFENPSLSELKIQGSKDLESLIHLINGLIFFSSNDFESAIMELDLAEANFNWSDQVLNRAILLNYRGVSNQLLGNDLLALFDLREAIEIEPEFGEGYNSLGVTYSKIKNYQDAIGMFSEAIKYTDEPEVPLNNRGLIQAKLGNVEEAIEDFEQAIVQNPSFPLSYINLGTAFSDQSRWDDAIEQFDKGIRLGLESPIAYYNRAFAYQQLGQYQKAISDYSRAIKRQPNFLAAYNNRALAYATQGKQQKAIEDLSAAIGIKPDFETGYLNRFDAYLSNYQFDKALDDYISAVMINPKHFRLILTFETNQDFYSFITAELQDEYEEYSQAIELDPANPDNYYERAYIIMLSEAIKQKEGNLKIALDDFQMFYKLTEDPIKRTRVEEAASKILFIDDIGSYPDDQ